LVSARLRAWLLVFAGIALAAVVLVPLFRSSSTRGSGPAALIGEPAPVIDLHDDRGKTVSLDQYRGKVVVMNLWATWCPPCRAEMPDLQTIADQFASDGVVIVGVNQGESANRAAAFAAALGIHFPIWLDQDQRYGRAYQALGMPTTVIVGRDGVIARAFDGALTIAQMRAAIAPLAEAKS
jgi:cytochrome c biogenesis protein CcmG, thiol:disulfide interchange protein DsbE